MYAIAKSPVFEGQPYTPFIACMLYNIANNSYSAIDEYLSMSEDYPELYSLEQAVGEAVANSIFENVVFIIFNLVLNRFINWRGVDPEPHNHKSETSPIINTSSNNERPLRALMENY